MACGEVLSSFLHALYKQASQPEAKLVGGMHVFVALMRVCHPLKAVARKHAPPASSVPLGP
jgi:hypothetical protein